ncbi:hypothetical protein J2W30_003708 [Variovorax boronicumulans]|uniref:hypothetical protein n=1 Tax=Variovorax boronicumulans TaxID=436515 RepID=UPI0027847289|nr:hypothetical protein [Variovorax boronicumulans]MDQ0035935.1 hypothetical protein [Variovorax boronicumulans]
MRALSGPTIAELSAREMVLVQLVLMQFPGFPVALCSANWDLVWGDFTYKGAAGLGTISEIEDSPGEIKGLQLEMSGVPSEYLALALDDAAIVQGAPLTILNAIVNSAGVVIDAVIDWDGRLDTMSIQEDGDTCTIAVTAESTAVDLLRGSPLTYNNVDQQQLYPGDRAFEFVNSQKGKPIVWAGKQWLLAVSGK